MGTQTLRVAYSEGVGMAVDKTERVPPTPETIAKLRKDYIGTLDRDLQETAGMIEVAWRLLCAQVMAKPQKLEPTTGGGGKAWPWTAGQNYVVVVYQAWCDEMQRRRLSQSIVIDMVVDGVPPWQADTAARWRDGKAAELLLEGLRLHQNVRRTVRIEGLDEAS